MITAYDAMQIASEAIRLGAIDCLGKPVDLDHLDEVVYKIFEMSDRSRNGVIFCESLDPHFQPNIMVGRSRTMKEVYKIIGVVADSGLFSDRERHSCYGYNHAGQSHDSQALTKDQEGQQGGDRWHQIKQTGYP